MVVEPYATRKVAHQVLKQVDNVTDMVVDPDARRKVAQEKARAGGS
jgi:hypothetical protein